MEKILPIAQLGAPVIRAIARPVTDLGAKETQEFIDELMLTCNDAKGMGISAPQVYRSERIFIMSSQPNERYPHAPMMKPIAVIEPEIIWHSQEMEKDWDGCLSLPGLRALVPRYREIEVSYMNREGEQVKAKYEGFIARLFQHEYDHLNGKVFIDRVESTLDVVMEREYQRMMMEKV